MKGAFLNFSLWIKILLFWPKLISVVMVLIKKHTRCLTFGLVNVGHSRNRYSVHYAYDILFRIGRIVSLVVVRDKIRILLETAWYQRYSCRIGFKEHTQIFRLHFVRCILNAHVVLVICFATKILTNVTIKYVANCPL